jgi:WD40 repeat protein
LASGDKSGTVKLWRPAAPISARKARSYPAEARANKGFTADAEHVYWRDHQDRIVVVNRNDPTAITRLEGAFPGAGRIEIGNDLSLIAVADAEATTIRRLPGMDPISRLSTGRADIHSLRFSPDLRQIAIVLAGGIVGVRDVHALAAAPLLEFDAQSSVRVTCFSPSGRFLAIGGDDGKLDLLDLSTGTPAGRWQESRLWITGIAFSADGRQLATSTEEGTITIRDVDTGQRIRSLRSGADAYWSVSFSRAGDRVAAGTGSGTIVIWDLASGEDLVTLQAHSQPLVGGLRFLEDGRTLFSWTGEEYRYWTID